MLHSQTREYLQQLEQILKQQSLWDENLPNPEATKSIAPFACDAMAFEQWLQFIFLPKMHALLDNQAELPSSIAIAPMAQHVWQHQPERKSLICLLDKLIYYSMNQDERLYEAADEVAPEIKILYEDEHLVAIHKPAGLLVHRTYLARKEKFFAMQLTRDLVGCHVFPVRRLDRPTSGVLLFAKSSQIANELCQQFADHKVQKRYLALVRGNMHEAGKLDYPLKEELDKVADKFVEDKAAQQAITDYRPLLNAEIPYSSGRYPT